ncbi:hypothetical protein P171DRAFT_255698 [Karstenula rhodostoma CBS 690.94]|uniref:Uncharacterized protein n=1 Tax=Karstenula rhodostoma CBS 690.94 TaxID=1392251 RepID=A0A9P4PJI6_9PLEO|nr:hypothetical protein P171DRAFT_255698 [Karstenula rhodostoma CBS 690.94]
MQGERVGRGRAAMQRGIFGTAKSGHLPPTDLRRCRHAEDRPGCWDHLLFPLTMHRIAARACATPERERPCLSSLCIAVPHASIVGVARTIAAHPAMPCKKSKPFRHGATRRPRPLEPQLHPPARVFRHVPSQQP